MMRFLSVGKQFTFGKSNDTRVWTSRLMNYPSSVETETNGPTPTLNHFKIFNEMMMKKISDNPKGQDVRLAIS